MINVGKWITKHKNIILLITVILLVPAVIGYITTRVNYDVLSYLPKSLETVEGQDIMVDEFGMGAFSMIVVDDMTMKEAAELEKQVEAIDHVSDVLWYDDVLDTNVPKEMLPAEIRDAFFHGDATMMIAFFEETTSADTTMDAIEEIRSTVAKNAYASGMSGVVTDIKNLALEEMPIYVLVAAVLCLVVLLITMDSLVAPLIFLLTIGLSILFNLGSNIFLGEISYITQALAAVLQLAVTMDYSIFLLESYEANKERFPGDKKRAMAHAVSNTFKSVSSSSVTTIAGFVALCFMTFKLGMDIGIVMSKGVIIGVLMCVTVLPAMILTFDKAIEKTTHKPLIPSLNKVSDFIIRFRYIALTLFVIILVPAVHGNNNYEIYYNLDTSLPKDIPSAIANEKLKENFDMSSLHMVLLEDGLTAKEKNGMLQEIKKVDGVKWVIGMDSLFGPNLPDTLIPEDVRSMLKTDNYELQFVCSDYASATDESNKQIHAIDKIVKGYQEEGMVIGEAPLMKDLSDVTNVDLENVNIISMAAIFLIILITFKSISIPVILVAIIEFAIACNMAVPFYTNTSLPFVASIVIGTIQLGATVDYAILMTSRYQKERVIQKRSKKDAIRIAHQTSIKSILTSGFCFFAATFGVSLYSRIDMIGSICTLLSRGSIISMVVVIGILPAMLWIFDGVIIHTSWDMIKEKVGHRDREHRNITIEEH
ncbi:MAG: MMPL family transporter [Lachnospiraceae bacterium]|jgi:Predicted exporters of the RND superfamily|nr:MMPL family transporter [Lachnospiraceae bacterium]